MSEELTIYDTHVAEVREFMEDRISEALEFSYYYHHHVKQHRKYTGEPYIIHPVEVYLTIRNLSEPPSYRMHTYMMQAALLHDTVEDTNVDIRDIHSRFGMVVGDMVDWLTDKATPEDGNRAARKKLERERLAGAPEQVKTLKLADMLSNVRSVGRFDPEFAEIYMEEKRLLLQVLKEGNQSLYHQVNYLISTYFRKKLLKEKLK